MRSLFHVKPDCLRCRASAPEARYRAPLSRASARAPDPGSGYRAGPAGAEPGTALLPSRPAHRAPRTAPRAPRPAHRAPRPGHRAPAPDIGRAGLLGILSALVVRVSRGTRGLHFWSSTGWPCEAPRFRGGRAGSDIEMRAGGADLCFAGSVTGDKERLGASSRSHSPGPAGWALRCRRSATPPRGVARFKASVSAPIPKNLVPGLTLRRALSSSQARHRWAGTPAVHTDPQALNRSALGTARAHAARTDSKGLRQGGTRRQAEAADSHQETGSGEEQR